MLENMLYFILIFYSITPLFVYAKQKFPRDYILHPLPKETLLLMTDETFRQQDKEIGQNGLTLAVSAYFQQQQTKTLFLLYRHPRYPLSLMLVSISNPNTATLSYLESTHIFEDHSFLNINNSHLTGNFPKSHRKVSLHYPEITSAEELVTVSRKIVDHYFYEKKPVALPEGEEMQMIEHYMNEELRELVDKGYLKKEASSNERGITLKGAYLFTWKLLWPFKQLISYKVRRHAQQILQGVA